MDNSNLKKCNVPFGIVPNELLNNNAISMKAKGLFAFMQSKPEGWNFSVEKIVFQCKESKLSVSDALKELENFGFLMRKKQQTGKGFVVEYHLYFEPISQNPMYRKPIIGNPAIGNPIIGNPMVRKSVNNSNKDISKKELIKKEEANNALAFFEINFPERFEILMMQYKKQITDFVKFSQLFDATVMQEKLMFEADVLEGRFRRYAINWISNHNEKPVIKLNLKTESQPAYMLKPLS